MANEITALLWHHFPEAPELMATQANDTVQIARSLIFAIVAALTIFYASPVSAGSGGNPAAPESKAVSEPPSPGVPTNSVADAPTRTPDDAIKIAVDQSVEAVTAALGSPNKMIVLGSKTIYIYPTIRVTFLNGKVDSFSLLKPAPSVPPTLVLSPLQSIGHAPKAVTRLEITSTSSGLMRGSETEISIWQEGSGYYMRSHIRAAGDSRNLTNEEPGNAPIDAGLIESLVKALDAPFRAAPSLAALGITPQWLKTNAHDIAEEASSTNSSQIKYGDGLSFLIPAKDIEAVLSDPLAMEDVAEGLFRSFRTDDYPHLQVNIVYQDGTNDSVSTDSQFPMMLPWIVQSGGKSARTFESAISRAVAALMPGTATNRARLLGDHIGQILAQPVVLNLMMQARTKDVENRSGDALQRLRAKFTVDSVSITHGPSPISSRFEENDEYLHAILTNSSSPGGLREAAALPLKRGKVRDIDAFLRSAASFENLVESVPWLNAYLRENSKLPFYLPIVDTVSLDDETLKKFAADMQAIGKQALIPKVEAVKDKIALLTEGSGFPLSQWLIFPDGRMILWKFNLIRPDKRTVLRWSISDFPWKPCAVLPYLEFVHCTGQEISPTGEFEPNQ